MQLDDLIAKTRELVGDVQHEGNTMAFTDDQVIVALNLAQCRLATSTRCTYMEVETDVGAEGIIDFLNPQALTEYGVMDVDRVRTLDLEVTPAPDATITTSADTYALAETPVIATVPVQTDATYLWSSAGAAISGSARGSSASFTLSKAGSIFLACTVTIHGTLATGTKTLTITED